MPTEDEFDFGEQPQNTQQQETSHPAIDAVGDIKATKRYDTDYSSGKKDTPASIKQKEARMYAIIGSHSIGAYDTGTRVKQIAQEDPQLYAELMQITADIQKYYKDQHGGWYNFWKRAGQEFDIGTANSAWNMATRIQSQKNNLFGQHAYLYGLGDDTVQQNATNNSEDFAENIVTAIDDCTPAQLVDIMHNIKKYYTYEVKVFDSLPDTIANKKAVIASMQRLDDYIAAWQKCQAKIVAYQNNPSEYKAFLTAYQVKPLSPLSEKERVYLKSVIDSLSAGQTLHNAMTTADFSIRVQEKANPLLGGKK